MGILIYIFYIFFPKNLKTKMKITSIAIAALLAINEVGN